MSRRPVGLGERDDDGLDALGAQRGDVVAVEGLEDDALVAGVEQSHEGGVEGAGGAGGDEDLGVGVDLETVEGRELFCDALAQAGDAVEARVDVVAVADGLDGGFGDGVRDVGVADALGHVDAADCGAGDGHGADLGLDVAGGEVAEAETSGGRSSERVP